MITIPIACLEALIDLLPEIDRAQAGHASKVTVLALVYDVVASITVEVPA